MMLKKRPVAVLCLILISLLSALQAGGVFQMHSLPGDQVAGRFAESGAEVLLTGEIRETETLMDAGSEILLDHVFLTEGKKKIRISGVRLLAKDGRYRTVGSHLMIRGTLKELSRARNPGMPDPSLLMRIKRIRYTMLYPEITTTLPKRTGFREGLAWMRDQMKKRICSVYPEDIAGLVCALLIGEKAELDTNTRLLWQRGGVSHMTCISGLHLSCLGAGLYGLFRKMRLHHALAGGLVTAFLAAYVVFTGLSVSAVRALLMFSIMTGARICGRTPDLITTLAVAALMILADNPLYLMYPGFQLSFLAVLIYAVFAGRSRPMQAVMLYMWMMPLVLKLFYEMPLLGVPLNAILLPCLPLMLALGIAGVILGPLTGGYLALPAVFLIRLMHAVLQYAEGMPFSTVITGKPSMMQTAAYLAGLFFVSRGLYVLRNDARRLLYLLLMPLLLVILIRIPSADALTGVMRRAADKQAFADKLKLVFLDVGQGDACLIQLPGGRNILVDSGSSTVRNAGRYRLLPFLKSEGIRKLDYAVATHADEDHMNGISELIGEGRAGGFPGVGTLVIPGVIKPNGELKKITETASRAGIRVLQVRSGDAIVSGKVSIRVLNPQPHASGEEDNLDSVVLLVRYGKFDALLAADIPTEGEKAIAQWLRKEGRRVDCLKVAHHGSRYSTGEEFLDAARPDLAIISAGSYNRYGHPHAELLDRLRGHRCRIFMTMRDGAVTVETDGLRYRAERFLKEKDS